MLYNNQTHLDCQSLLLFHLPIHRAQHTVQLLEFHSFPGHLIIHTDKASCPNTYEYTPTIL